MTSSQGLVSLDLLIKEIESLKRAREILFHIYATSSPYEAPKISSDSWKDMQDYFGFDDSE